MYRTCRTRRATRCTHSSSRDCSEINPAGKRRRWPTSPAWPPNGNRRTIPPPPPPELGQSRWPERELRNLKAPWRALGRRRARAVVAYHSRLIREEAGLRPDSPSKRLGVDFEVLRARARTSSRRGTLLRNVRARGVVHQTVAFQASRRQSIVDQSRAIASVNAATGAANGGQVGREAVGIGVVKLILGIDNFSDRTNRRKFICDRARAPQIRNHNRRDDQDGNDGNAGVSKHQPGVRHAFAGEASPGAANFRQRPVAQNNRDDRAGEKENDEAADQAANGFAAGFDRASMGRMRNCKIRLRWRHSPLALQQGSAFLAVAPVDRIFRRTQIANHDCDCSIIGLAASACATCRSRYSEVVEAGSGDAVSPGSASITDSASPLRIDGNFP